MKNLIVLAVALIATNAFAADWKWNGSAGWRWDSQNLNDSLGSVDSSAAKNDTSTEKVRQHEARANLGVTGGWDHVEWGVDMRTQGASLSTGKGGGALGLATAANTDWTPVGGKANAASDATIGLDSAYFRYVHDFGAVDANITVGRGKTALITDTTWETLYSNATRFQGFSEGLKFGMFGLNMTQYVEGAVTAPNTESASEYNITASGQANANKNTSFAMTYQFQPYMTWKFTDEIETLFAVAYTYSYDESHVNTAGGYDPSTWDAGNVNNVSNGLSTGDIAEYRMNNRRSWDFLNTWTLPYTLNFTGELILGQKAVYDNQSLTVAPVLGTWVNSGVGTSVSSTAWNLGLTYGKLKKAMDFTVGYAYGSKGIASVVSDYTNPWFAADQKGHHITAGFALADNLSLGFNAYFLKEKQGIDAKTGVAYGAAPGSVAALSNEKLSDKMWELNTAVSF